MSTVSQRSGRRDSTERIRELVALLGSLRQHGDSLTVDAVSRRLGITLAEAEALIEILLSASGEESAGLLLSSNDDGSEYTLQYQASVGRPVRLTRTETWAVLHALDFCGIPEDDELYRRVVASLASPEVTLAEIRRELGEGSFDENLLTCVWAQVEERVLTFDYQGLADDAPRRRRTLVRRLRRVEGDWHVLAHDLDIERERTFRMGRMSHAALGEVRRMPASRVHEQTRMVKIHFLTQKYYRFFPWPGLHVLEEKDGIIHAEIPYFGAHSPYLARRIAACEGTVTVDDEGIMEASRAYAASLLKRSST